MESCLNEGFQTVRNLRGISVDPWRVSASSIQCSRMCRPHSCTTPARVHGPDQETGRESVTHADDALEALPCGRSDACFCWI